MILTWYDTRTGRVLGRRHGRADGPLRGPVGVIEGDWSQGYWIDPETREPVALEPMPVQVTGQVLSGLPAGTVIARDGVEIHTANGAPLGLAVDYDETVVLDLSHPRHVPLRLTVACVAGAATKGEVLRIAQDVLALRAKAYPPLAEQLDALWKGGAEADAMRERVRAVKARLPKRL